MNVFLFHKLPLSSTGNHVFYFSFLFDITLNVNVVLNSFLEIKLYY